MRLRLMIILSMCLAANLACGQSGPVEPPFETTQLIETSRNPEQVKTSTFERKGIEFGFFPSPPEPTFEAVLQHFVDLGDHADFILIQPNIPWMDFQSGIEGNSQAREDIRNQVILARQNGLDAIFVVDPLNGLNRREFFELPVGWQASFSDPAVRQSYINFSIWLVQEFQPRYLGLASEINTYMDAHPDEVVHFHSLYLETYRQVKEISTETQVFVSFQWDDLNNMFAGASEGRQALHTNWEQVELFEPDLDLWVISSYPYFIFNGGDPIPDDYYSPLLDRTEKPLAVAEGGFSSRPVGPIRAEPEDQVEYLRAIHDQLGSRLEFWVYILLNDLRMDPIAHEMERRGRPSDDIETLSMFANVGLRQADGTAKPALEVWNSLRFVER